MSLLTRQEICDLTRKAQAGDLAARDMVVTRNLPLVISIAPAFLNRGLDLDDLIGEGNLGLIKAVGRFDPGFGVTFATYATYWIKESIHKALRDTVPLIRIPTHMVALLGKLRRARNTMIGSDGRRPGLEEVAVRIGLSQLQRDLVAKALHAVIRRPKPESRRTPWIEPGPLDQPDPALPVESVLEATDSLASVRHRLDVLDARERSVMDWRFPLDNQEPMHFATIGAMLGLTRERVRQIEALAIRKMQRATPFVPMGSPGAGA